ncbi:hypothetical protein ACFC6L_29400 [Kitasatospora phosalacinea]|uniref:hypothetical protein n=1 Tax=Kitasatospora phosalacinea TaxID=2065 RepID=UPI0035E3BB6E
MAAGPGPESLCSFGPLGGAANGPWYRIAATAVVVGVALMSTVLLVQALLGWFGPA